MISAHELELRAGARLLLESVSFQVAAGDTGGGPQSDGTGGAGDQRKAGGATPRKLASRRGPMAVRIDSGWNWTPSMPRWR